MTAGDLIIESDAGDGLTKAVFEDDGRVAYCYILENGEIKSDVWIYNRASAPIDPDIRRQDSDGPNLNPGKYALTAEKLPEHADDISIEWQTAAGMKPTAIVKTFGLTLARVSAETKPGYARLARLEGPLAKPLAP